MSPTGTKIPGSTPSTDDIKLTRYYKQASTSRWDIYPLFQSFLQNRSAETIKAVQDRRLLISWDLKAIHFLRTCLQKWVLAKVPGDAIGAFLIRVLYQQDHHLLNLATLMIYTRKTQMHIARQLLVLYEISNEAGDLIWDDLAIYPDLNPNSELTVKDARRAPTDTPIKYRLLVQWVPYLRSLCDSEVDELVDKVEKSRDLDEEDLPPLFAAVREEDFLISQELRTIQLRKNDGLGIQRRTAIAEEKADRSQRQLSLSSTGSGESLRVSVFQPEVPVEEQAPGDPDEPGQGKSYMRSTLSSRARVGPKEPLPVVPWNLGHVPCSVLPCQDVPRPPAQLEKKSRIEDLRKIWERDA
jgi:hypothetical protein